MNSRRREQLRGPDGENAPKGEFISAGGFQGPDYGLDFCIDEHLAIDLIRLIYDSDPNGGLPIPKTELATYKQNRRGVL